MSNHRILKGRGGRWFVLVKSVIQLGLQIRERSISIKEAFTDSHVLCPILAWRPCVCLPSAHPPTHGNHQSTVIITPITSPRVIPSCFIIAACIIKPPRPHSLTYCSRYFCAKIPHPITVQFYLYECKLSLLSI